MPRGKPFQKGQSGNPKGKPKGTANRLTVEVKAMVEEALNRAGEDTIKRHKELDGMSPGAAYLAKQAHINPTAFMSLVAKVIPNKVDLDVTVMSEQMTEILAQRRQQLSELKDVTPIEQPKKRKSNAA